ncbi:MAG: M1 family aminopeptidase [Terracidiphilus sp.]|nr:M1 family aminopeptidase [Terracidiphilus sp.]MDR3798123.1 M1 family aminopeptidase [Terracidiphilus sp.]
MKFRRNAFSIGASCCASIAIICLLLSFSHAAQAQRLSDNVIPSHYSLEFTPDLKAATFSGFEVIDVNIKAPTNVITLNAIELKIGNVEIDSHDGGAQAGSVSLDPEKQQAALTFAKNISAGDATLKIHFTGILNNELRGFYLSKTAKRNYAVTQFESTDARRAFPCFDEPALKATYDIALTIDAGDTAISNSAIASDTPGPGPGKHTLVFATTPKMSTYLVAFVVGDFQCTRGEQDGVALRVCATPDKVALTPFALDVAKFALRYYDHYFGIHYPLKKLDLIGVPDFEAGAMENFGAITFRETDLLLDPKTASIRSQRNATLAIVHEIAHQWFGDLVTMKWWDNVWLNEGFATWMENKCTGAMHPEWEIPQFVAADEQRTLNVDAQPTTRAIRARADTPEEIDQMFDSIAYNKAGAALLMVENYLGEETFRKGVHAYLAAHEYGNATAEDFWNAQTEVSHKPVDKIMESLVAEPGAPLLKFGPPGEFGVPAGGQVPVAQSRFFLSPGITPDPGQKWTIPVCFKAGAKKQDCQVLTPSSPSLSVPAARVFFANAGGNGYYRSAYAPAQYAALVAQVETSLTPEERISLTGDEWAQVRADKATVGDYLDLVAALRSDPSSDVLSNAIENVSVIKNSVASTQEERNAIAAWIRQTFAPVYAQLGNASASDTSNQRALRAYLFSILASAGKDAALKAQARQIADQYLSAPASIDPGLGQIALSIAAKDGDAELFDKLQKIYETSNDPELQNTALRQLVLFTNPELLERGLEYSVSPKVRNQDSARLFNTAMRIPENRDATWNFIKTHWDQVQAEFTTEMGSYLVDGTGDFCSVEARDDVKNFFAAHPVPATNSTLRHALEHIDGCIELRRLQEPNLKKWLAAQGQ